MKLLDSTYKLFSSTEAEQKAAELSKNDPDWTYKVRHDPKGTGFSFIKIYDETGEFISKL